MEDIPSTILSARLLFAGKHVVLQLLQQNQNVRAIARSKERLLNLLDEAVPESSVKYAPHLEVTEASILDLSEEELNKAVQGCDAVVSCLGHNLTFKGMFFPPRRLVTDANKRLCQAIEATNNKEGDEPTRFILMGTDGVANPAGGDDKRTSAERVVLTLLHYLLPPHADNEKVAAYTSGIKSAKIEWTVVRPTDLINGDAKKYQLFSKPQGRLFGGDGITTRATVAKFMVDLIMNDKLWNDWKCKMPVVYDKVGDVACT